MPDDREFEELLPRLTRLVWLRESYLPDWFRAALLARLPPAQAQTVRQVLTAILAQVGTAPDDSIPLRIATDEPAPPRGGGGPWPAVRDWLRRRRPAQTLQQAVQHAAPDSPLADHVFIRFMSGRRDPALLLPVPPALLKLLYPQGAVLYGLRGSLALTLAVALSLVVMVGLETMVDLPPLRSGPAGATKEQPWVNTLGMKFVPVPGTEVLFSVWDTRVQDYAAYAAANPGVDSSGKNPMYENVPVTPGLTHPVVNVSWDDAVAFAKWLTAKEQSEGRLPKGARYRLPTDAEWSVAVGLNESRSGTPSDKDEKIKDVYPWGKQWPPPKGAGNFADTSAKAKFPSFNIIEGYTDGYATTSPVGSFDVNPFGLYDLSGNVWQWCEDFYDGKSGERVLRGGSWGNDTPLSLLSSGRSGGGPEVRNDDYGFRLGLVVGALP